MKKPWKTALILAVTSVVTFVLVVVGLRMSAPWRHQREFERKLLVFESILSRLRADPSDIPASGVEIPVPDSAKGDVRFIFASRPTEETLAVEFLTGGGFPVKHRGFFFLSAGQIEDYPRLASRWPRHTRMRDNWFYIAD